MTLATSSHLGSTQDASEVRRRNLETYMPHLERKSIDSHGDVVWHPAIAQHVASDVVYTHAEGNRHSGPGSTSSARLATLAEATEDVCEWNILVTYVRSGQGDGTRQVAPAENFEVHAEAWPVGGIGR